MAELKRGIIAGMIAGIVVGLITLLIIPKNFPIWDSGYQFRVYVFPILGFIMGIGFGAAYAMIYDLLLDISGKVKATIAVVSICIIRWPIDFAFGYRYIATGLVSSLLFWGTRYSLLDSNWRDNPQANQADRHYTGQAFLKRWHIRNLYKLDSLIQLLIKLSSRPGSDNTRRNRVGKKISLWPCGSDYWSEFHSALGIVWRSHVMGVDLK